MNDILAKLVATWLALGSPDGGVPARYLRNHDGDTVTLGIACTGPVRITMMIEGVAGVSVFAPPLVREIPCSAATRTIPLEVRVAGIDTPEIGASPCPTQAGRNAERAAGIAAREAVGRWLKGAASVSLHDLDPWSEKWGRTLGRIEFTGPVGSDQAGVPRDLGAALVLGHFADPYGGETKSRTSFCDTGVTR